MAFSTPSGAPSSKEKKYDRQLRLWGANGQNRLEKAHIALFNASATGCEILKNLILPCIGQFTVIDDKLVDEADLGVNFFLDEDSLGKPRAERAAALLGELNPDVKGNYIVDNLSNLLSTKPELFGPSTTPFTHLTFISPLPTPLLLLLPPEIPTFLVYSLGFTTSLRVSAPTHTIVETHPDSLTDLRLLNPWPELSNMAIERTKNLEVQQTEEDGNLGMGDHEHGHVPYLILLLKYLEDWKRDHGGSYPTTYKEKGEFKALIQDRMRTYVPGGSEENYEEAIAAVLKNVREAEISSETKEVLNDIKCANLTTEVCSVSTKVAAMSLADTLDSKTESFWIIARAVKDFLENPEQGNGLLPLSGGIPDMKAESNGYVDLQNVYKYKARRDASLVKENVRSILSSLKRDPSSIPPDEIELFCRNSNFLRRISYRPLSAEFSTPPDKHHKKAVCAALSSWDAGTSLIHDYIALRAYQSFITKTGGRTPGDTDGTLEEDTAEMTRLAESYLKEVGWGTGLEGRGKDMIREVVRAGGGELHNIASLSGGIVAQEVIKVITQQYVPVNNTVVFDGISSRTGFFEL